MAVVEVDQRVLVHVYRYTYDYGRQLYLYIHARRYPDLCRLLRHARWVVARIGRYVEVLRIARESSSSAIRLYFSRYSKYAQILARGRCDQLLIRILYIIYETEEEARRAREVATA